MKNSGEGGLFHFLNLFTPYSLLFTIHCLLKKRRTYAK